MLTLLIKHKVRTIIERYNVSKSDRKLGMAKTSVLDFSSSLLERSA